MEELYWITRFDNIKILCCLATVGSIIVFVITMAKSADLENKDKEVIKNYPICAILSLLLVILFIALFALTPNTGEGYMIYGVGETLDHIQNDSIANQLPESVVKACEFFLGNKVR